MEPQRRIINFCSCHIAVRQGIFHPRVETEYWVKRVIRKIKSFKKRRGFRILDIFAGTGCIGIAILKSIRNAKVDFVEIDKNTINEIKINLRLNKIRPGRFRIYQSNLFEAIKTKKYDFIVANPPYVAKERLYQVSDWVKKYEPKIAWYGGKLGMRYIRKFLRELDHHLLPNGYAFFECDPYQKDEIENILRRFGSLQFRFLKDQFGKFRCVEIKNQKKLKFYSQDDARIFCLLPSDSNDINC